MTNNKGKRLCILRGNAPFPSVEEALEDPNGLLAVGGDLSAARLLDAYGKGIFPWYSEGEPILWWSPNPRMVLFPDEIHVSRSLKKRLRRGGFEVRQDTAFRQVMLACAVTQRGDEEHGTWITTELLEAYCELHRLGYAHSVETWINGELAGGLYGVRIGRMFYGESMFQRVTDASKIAFVHLVNHLKQEGVGLIDCQMNTAHLASLGAREIPRTEFIRRLKQLTRA